MKPPIFEILRQCTAIPLGPHFHYDPSVNLGTPSVTQSFTVNAVVAMGFLMHS